MIRRLLAICLLVQHLNAQSIKDCEQRFQSYLNFRSSLNSRVKFDPGAIHLLSPSGKKEFSIYEHELPALSNYFLLSSVKEQQQLMNRKATQKWSQRQCDSLLSLLQKSIKREDSQKDSALKGYRIAIDPGHFSTNLIDAQAEQKYLYFAAQPLQNPGDTVKLFESLLTFQTAMMVKQKLEAQGANVFVTRTRADFTTFNCTFQEWIKFKRRNTLDSLLHLGALTPQKHKHLLSCSTYDLFWDFFRDYDLDNRAKKINAFHPDLTLIIHYNVDEKNAPWKKCTDKNFTMAFIGGGYTSSHLIKPEAKANFVRQLITTQLNESEKLSATTVSYFNKTLQIPIAKTNDATYLKENCITTASAGVYCRNLALCRKINSVLVYGESLYQDNTYECKDLMRCDLDVYGFKTNNRLHQVATAYFQAVLDYLRTSKNL